MKMSDADQIAYRAFRYYVKVNIPEVANIPAIVFAIKKLAGKTSTATIKNALKWGREPTIRIVTDLRGSDGKKAFGLYSWGSNVIQVDRALVEEFCAGKGTVVTAHGRKVYLLGATLLHELTHWSDAQDGVDDEVAGDPTNEEGNQFERDVYGGITG
jgi:hypothetical protein